MERVEDADDLGFFAALARDHAPERQVQILREKYFAKKGHLLRWKAEHAKLLKRNRLLQRRLEEAEDKLADAPAPPPPEARICTREGVRPRGAARAREAPGAPARPRRPEFLRRMEAERAKGGAARLLKVSRGGADRPPRSLSGQGLFSQRRSRPRGD